MRCIIHLMIQFLSSKERIFGFLIRLNVNHGSYQNKKEEIRKKVIYLIPIVSLDDSRAQYSFSRRDDIIEFIGSINNDRLFSYELFYGKYRSILLRG